VTEVEQLTTKQIVQRTFDAIDQIKSGLESRDQAKASAAKPEYTESDALKRCVIALAAIPGNSSSSYSYKSEHAESVRRVLRYLADRFGVSLVEMREQPCARLHLEEASQQALIDALRNPQL
jgi:hypothetical protein